MQEPGRPPSEAMRKPGSQEPFELEPVDLAHEAAPQENGRNPRKKHRMRWDPSPWRSMHRRGEGSAFLFGGFGCAPKYGLWLQIRRNVQNTPPGLPEMAGDRAPA